jgi:hypothetical protein
LKNSLNELIAAWNEFAASGVPTYTAELTNNGPSTNIGNICKVGEEYLTQTALTNYATVSYCNNQDIAVINKISGWPVSTFENDPPYVKADELAKVSGDLTHEIVAANATAVVYHIGAIFAYLGKDTPPGAQPLNGTVISDVLPDGANKAFYRFLQDGNIPKVSEETYDAMLKSTGNCGGFVDLGNGKIKLPTLTAGLPWGTTSDKVCTTISAGLPNITGKTYAGNNYSVPGAGSSIGFHNTSGSFQLSEYIYKQCVANGGSTGAINSLEFDASKSNPIYGNSNTVQPPGIGVRWFIQVSHPIDLNLLKIDVIRELNDLEFGSMPDFTKMVEMFKLHTGDKWIATLNDVFKINVPGYIYITSSNYNANSDIDSDFIINVSNAAENFYTPQKSANYNPNFARLHKTVDNYAYGGGDSMPFSIIPGKNTWLAFTSWSTTKHVYVYFVPTKYITKHFPEIVPSSYFTNGKIFTNSGNGLTRL